MSKVENYTKFAENVAKDDTHGYDQVDRNGNPNYDCSGLVIKAVDQSGIDVKGAGATYTGNMKNAFIKKGFKNVTSKITLSTGKGLIRGDVLLNEGHHTAIYCGNGKMVDARINEKGTATGGKSGDQTGHEIEIHAYNNHPWNCVLRYPETSSTSESSESSTGSSSSLKFSKGDKVKFTGSVHYTSSSKSATGRACKAGQAKITAVNAGSAHPYHLVAVTGKGSTVYGWVNEDTVKAISSTTSSGSTPKVGDKVTVTGYYYENGNGGDKKKVSKKTMYVTDIVSSKTYKYYIGVTPTKGGARWGWIALSSIV